LDANNKKSSSVNLDDLRYYFDAQEKNLLDLGQFARRTGQVLHLRHRLLSLPTGEFDQAMGAIEKIVAGPDRQMDQKSQSLQQRQEAIELFERAAGQSSGASVDNVAKI